MPKRHLITKERRRNPRIKETLKVIRCGTKYLLETNALSKDISENGICILTPYRMEIGETLNLGIYLPEYKKPIIATGRVVRRVETNDKLYPYILGIEFIKINQDGYKKIVDHIKFYILKNY